LATNLRSRHQKQGFPIDQRSDCQHHSHQHHPKDHHRSRIKVAGNFHRQTMEQGHQAQVGVQQQG
jgi:hypothetical protein